MVGGYAEHSRPTDAIEVYDQVRQEGGRPNEVTYLSILKACACPAGAIWGKEIHAHSRRSAFRMLKYSFGAMAERNVITWNVMTGGPAQYGYGHEAFSLFLQMQEGFVPDATNYLSILTATVRTSAGALRWVKEVHRHTFKAGFDSDMCNAKVDDARLVFDGMLDPDVIRGSAMI
uniref:Uncharacterized protein n=1 Tax=Physcomitrium patens TaxID=3218 RepID=A0A7I4F891_PHYPA